MCWFDSENKDGPNAANRGPGLPLAQGIRHRMRLKIRCGWTNLIPAVREAMDVGENGAILAWLEKGELRLVSPKVALQQVEAARARLAHEGQPGG